MLYDGVLRFIRSGIEGIESRNYEQANNNLCKAQAIVHELVSSLNFDYPISKDLVNIYDYVLRLLIEANIKKNVAPALEALEHLSELREAWVQASRLPAVGEL